MLIVFACAAFHAAFAFGVSWSAVSAQPSLPAAPFLWFPWNALAASARDRFSMEFARLCGRGNLAFVQLTAITGIFGLSLLVAAYNALLAGQSSKPRVGIGADSGPRSM